MGMGSLYSSFLYILAFLSINASMLTNFASSLKPSCFDNERIALLNFKQSFHIDCAFSSHSPLASPKVNSWTSTDNEYYCSWEGVECDEDTGQVIGLDLSNSCLHGSFPPNSSLFSLFHLRVLNLAFNDFNYSKIPSQFRNFHKLKRLNLSNSAFSGQIPLDISKLSELLLLDISNNNIQAYNTLSRLHEPTIEKLLQNLTSLQVLSLDTVDISSAFPTFLSNLTSLKLLSLQFCNLYGELPPNIFRLPHLEFLNLGENTYLNGFLPEFQWHSPLKVIFLSFTSLSGELPPSIGKVAHLEVLGLEGCKFSGLLPSSLGNLTTLSFMSLDANNFHGDIPFSLMNLTNLNGLGLSNLNVKPGKLFSQLPQLNKLTALALCGMKLDSETLSLLANFTRLQILDLGSTNLKGHFPYWLANLTQLTTLLLYDNELTGHIPEWFFQLTNLYMLELAENSLIGKFETFLKLKNLQFLDLSDNNIVFPTIFQNNASLLQLNFLGLSRCNLTEFPQFLKLQNQLHFLLLANNNLVGSIPQWFVTITKDRLFFIDLSSNNFTGFEKPAANLAWNNLEYMDLRYNKLQGQLPIPPKSIKHYLVSSNMFSGDIPNDICNARSLISLDLSNNMLSGQIPHCVANKLGDSLQVLDIGSNSLTGIVPQEFTRFCKLKMINLSNNKLKGDLPKSLINCLLLEVIDIGRNCLNDTFPSWLGNLTKLQALVLNHNNFHGKILDPKFDHDFRLLRIIDLSHNLHSGDLPSSYLRNWNEMEGVMENQSDTSNIFTNTFLQVGPYESLYEQRFEYSITITNKGKERLYPKILKVFRVIDFSSNNFTGRIPDIIGSLQGLQALNLSNNNLHGRIPSSLANITDLESLDLSHNMLSGEIPLAMSQLTTLEVFDVSYNQLEGSIPTGNQFNTFDNEFFQGNVRLCGMPLAKVCDNVDAPQLPDVDNEDSMLTHWIIRSFGFVCGCIVGYVIGKLFITDKYHNWFMDTLGR